MEPVARLNLGGKRDGSEQTLEVVTVMCCFAGAVGFQDRGSFLADHVLFG